MSVPILRIAASGRGKRAKSRSFEARLLGYLTADGWWVCEAEHHGIHPVWLSYFGSEQEVRAVTANLRAGKLAEVGTTKLEMPRSAGFRWQAEAVAGGVVVTAWLPWLFALDAVGGSQTQVRFVFAPPRWWLDRQAASLVESFGAEAREAARAALFAAYLDRRTEVPILPDLRFRLRLYRAALEEPWLTQSTAGSYKSSDLRCLDLTQQGLEEPVAVNATSAAIEAFVSLQTQLFLEEEHIHGTTGSASSGRLLPSTEAVALQHCLDFVLAASGG
jgi:hypothetical protein